jgi:hypothetical protein
MPPLPSLSPGYQFCTGAVLDVRVIERNEFDDGGVKLVFVAHRRGATFQIS